MCGDFFCFSFHFISFRWSVVFMSLSSHFSFHSGFIFVCCASFSNLMSDVCIVAVLQFQIVQCTFPIYTKIVVLYSYTYLYLQLVFIRNLEKQPNTNGTAEDRRVRRLWGIQKQLHWILWTVDIGYATIWKCCDSVYFLVYWSLFPGRFLPILILNATKTMLNTTTSKLAIQSANQPMICWICIILFDYILKY